ncbi:MAG: class I SAM-dependent methyltransferase, partial [Planctomycetota bacterium]
RYTRKRGWVLNIGASWGRDTLFLAMNGSKVVSMDIDFNNDVFAGGVIWPDNVQADAQDIPFKADSFHTVILAECLEHIVDDQKVIREAIDVLVPGGRLIVSVPLTTGGKEYHLRGYQPSQIKKLFTDYGLEIKKIILRGGLITWTPYFNPQLQKITIGWIRKWILEMIARVDLIIGLIRFRLLKRSLYAGTYIVGAKTKSSDL